MTTPEEAGPLEQHLEFIHERHDETGSGPIPESPRTPENEDDEAGNHMPGFHL